MKMPNTKKLKVFLQLMDIKVFQHKVHKMTSFAKWKRDVMRKVMFPRENIYKKKVGVTAGAMDAWLHPVFLHEFSQRNCNTLLS